MLDLGPAAAEVARLVRSVGDDQLSDPTPCPEYSVAALLDHLMALSIAFTWGANKLESIPEGADESPPGRATAEHLRVDWRTELPDRLAGLSAAWAQQSAWEGMATVGGATMPAETTGVFALDELVLHGWDLARSTGQEFHCDPASTAAVLELTTGMARPDQAASRQGLFGPVADVPADAPELDRALALSGRDPAWR